MQTPPRTSLYPRINNRIFPEKCRTTPRVIV